jgi:hypothetical protein
MDASATTAAAELYHAYFTGLMLTVASRRNGTDAAEWVFRVFRHQHHEKFLSSFDKLGLNGLPHPIACAAYHYLSNAVGGVDVEFMRESDDKAWVRFVPPRWIYPGATICGVPSEVSRAMLRGWYAYNGVSLGNPRLGFVCTAQTVDGQHGLAGYFLQHAHDLSPEERLQFRPGELPPPFDPARAPTLPEGGWPAERLTKAKRNYAMEYVRSGLPPARRAVRTGRRRPSRTRDRTAHRRSVLPTDGGPPRRERRSRRGFRGLDDSARRRRGGRRGERDARRGRARAPALMALDARHRESLAGSVRSLEWAHRGSPRRA